MLYRGQLSWCLVPTELSHPDMILLVCAYICFPLWSAQLCVNFSRIYFSIWKAQPRNACQKHSGRRFVELENQGAENNQNNTNDDNDIQSDSCRKPFMWNELICSDGKECILHGLVSSPVATKLLRLAAAAAGFTTLLNSLKATAASTVGEKKTQNKRLLVWRKS